MPDTNSAFSPLERLEPAQRERTVSAMQVLRTRARTTNLARVAQLDQALDAAAAQRLDETGRSHAVAVAHQLIGSAGTFGYARASEEALGLKEFFASRAHSPAQVQRAREVLAVVRRDLETGPDAASGDAAEWAAEES